VVRLTALGWKADAALRRTGGSARVLAALSESIYLTAGDEIVWLGRATAPLHPRAMLTEDALPLRADALELDADGVRPWTPPAPARTLRPETLVAGVDALVAAIHDIGTPDGFGALLVGATPPFPLDGAADRARQLAAACAADDPRAAAEAATALLGLGPGLTPSGDDYVGAAFFAHALLVDAGVCDAAAWARAAAGVRARALSLTHPISAALLADMLEGHGHAPLHDLARALGSGVELAGALDAARRLARIGHSSGWDMLAGFVAGISAGSARQELRYSRSLSQPL
jgi:hypothetical protein